MKIALVSPYDFSFPGGVTNHISALEHRLTRMGNDVRVIAPASRTVHVFGDRFIPIGKPRPVPSSGSICRITLSLNLASTIKTVLDRERFDIIHLHEPFMPMLCTAMLRFSNTVNVGTFHACDGSPGYSFGWPITTMMIARRIHKLHGRIAVSVPAMEYGARHLPGRDYTIIPNGINIEHFSPCVTTIEEFADGRPNILFVGRLEHRKGLFYLLKAFHSVKREIPESRLIVVGPGTRLRKRYERWVNDNKIPDVIFKGYVSYADLPRYYKTATVYCSPATSRESFGIVLLEAMSVGAPVVASSIAGYASVINHGEDGLLVPPKDSHGLAQTLVSLIKDEKLRQQLTCKGMLKAKAYSWEYIASRVFDFYMKVLEQTPLTKQAGR